MLVRVGDHQHDQSRMILQGMSSQLGRDRHVDEQQQEGGNGSPPPTST